MKKNRRYRRSFSKLNKFITKAQVTEFTDDQDIILKLDDKKKTQALYIPSNKDPVLKIGDNILVEIIETHHDDNLLSAKFINIIDNNKIKIIGIFFKQNNKSFLHSILKGSKKKWAVDPSFEKKAIDGDLVEAYQPLSGSQYQKKGLEISRIVGNIHNAKSLSLIAIAEHNIPNEFSKEILNGLGKNKNSQPNQMDLRDLPFITIDPADARDHDDAVFAEEDTAQNNLGGYIIWVAIADVAKFVKIDSPIDIEAEIRGNSTYFTDRVVPMLPEIISTDLCSLNENQERSCIAVRMKINSIGEKIEHKFVRATIISKASLKYEEVQDAFDGTTNNKTDHLYEKVLRPLYLAYQSTLLAKKKRQPLNLNLPDREIQLNDNGEVSSIKFKKQLEAHELIEEFMVMANVCAAETLTSTNTDALYRVHEEPKLERAQSLNETIKSIGLNAPNSKNLKTSDLNKLLNQAEGTDYSKLINFSVLRTMTQAYYAKSDSSHFGLNLRKYTHFTSPIRRYADLIVHRALIAAHGWDKDISTKAEKLRLEKIAVHISMTERRSMVAERETVDRYMAQYLKNKIGQEFNCIISGITRFGIFIQINEIGADGLIPLSNFSNEYFRYNEKDNSLIGSLSNQKIQVGMNVTALLIEADETSGGLRFKLSELNGQNFDQSNRSNRFKIKKSKLKKKKT